MILSKKPVSKFEKTTDGKFRCPIGEQTFDSKADFDRHFRKAHTAEEGLI